MTARATLNRILENGNISSEEFDKVYNAAHQRLVKVHSGKVSNQP